MERGNRRKADQLRRGEEAEREVAAILAKLPGKEYAVFNNVQTRYGDIDHIVIRRDGAVYLLEDKSHRGRVTWDGKRLLLNGWLFEKDFICQINMNIAWLRELLKKRLGVNPWIVACLVFPNALLYSDKNKRVLRLRPVKRVNVVCTGFLKRLIELYVPRTARPEIWEQREAMFLG